MIVTALDVDTEACADVVEDKDNSVIVAEFAHLLPISFRRKLVVDESGMIVRRCDECRNLTGILLDEFFELVGCVPIDIEVVCYIFFGYTRISEFLHPRRNAVIVTADEHDFLAVGVCTCNHDREVGCVAAVLCEERPVCHVDGVDHFFREVDEQFGSKRCAVAFLSCSIAAASTSGSL